MALQQHIRLDMEQPGKGLSLLSGLCTRERSESSLPWTSAFQRAVEVSPRELQLPMRPQRRRQGALL
jgi:hypothetical protein